MTGLTEPSGAGHFTVAVHFLQLLTDYATRQNLPLQSLLAQAGIRLDATTDPNGRVPYVAYQSACERVAQALGDPCLGLKLGQSVRPGHLGSHGFALMSCATLHELAQQASRYSALTMDAGHNVFELRGQEYVRYWRSNLPGDAPMGRLQDEMQQAIAVTLVRWCSNREDINPRWVAFQHARPDDVREYEALFRCPVHFGAQETAISMDASYIDLPLPNANPQLRRIMDDLSASLLKQLGSTLEPNWLAIARRTAIDAFQRGLPEIGHITQATGMTEAELKEQLAQRGTSFRSFIDDLRRALAVGYMRDPDLGLVDIAYLLGFSEQSAFQRAFKRWTGTTPGDYRRSPPLQASGLESP